MINTCPSAGGLQEGDRAYPATCPSIQGYNRKRFLHQGEDEDRIEVVCVVFSGVPAFNSCGTCVPTSALKLS